MRSYRASKGRVVLICVTVAVLMSMLGLTVKMASQALTDGMLTADARTLDQLPAPAAGVSGTDNNNSGCRGLIYQASTEGIRYVRESGGGRYYAAEIDNEFGIYRLTYGHLVRVAHSELDPPTLGKLRHALYHCDGTYLRSGLSILAGNPNIPRG